MIGRVIPSGRTVLVLFLLCVIVIGGQPAVAQSAPASDSITYVVKSGDRLVDIAARYGVTASAIVRANNLANADTIFPGQQLIIPTSGTTGAPGTSTGSSTASRPTTYTVKLGDTLAAIAKVHGVSIAAIQQASRLVNPNILWVGQKLTIPAAGATGTAPQPAPTPKPAAAGPTIHVVQAGETLSIIARRYGVSVDALVATNGLGSPNLIRVGMRLIIPGKSGTAGSTGTAITGKVTKFVASISQQRCWLYSGETVIARWVCSTGRRGAATVPGTYKIQSKMAKAYGSTWNIWMPFWLGIYWAGASENGIHGLPWDAKTGVQIWSGNVGIPITYGCIMLDNVNAKTLYDAAYIGMPVVIRP